MYQRKTLRALPLTARKLAKTANALELEVRRLHRLIPVIAVHEKVYTHMTTRGMAGAEAGAKLRDALQTELPMVGCAEHGKDFAVNCPACSDAWFNRSVTGLEAAVTRDLPEVPS